MTSLTPEEVDGNGDLCTRAYAEWTLGCGHGNRPEVGHGDKNQVNLIFSTPDNVLEKMVKHILTSQKDREARSRAGKTHFSHKYFKKNKPF